MALVVLAGCASAGDLVESRSGESGGSGDSQATRTRSTTGPDEAAAPETGECRRLTMADIEPPTNDDSPVPCRKRHTAVTYHVGEWPEKLVEKARGVGDRRLRNYVIRRCDRAWRRTVGGTREIWATSIVSWAWYRPTKAQFDDGATWFRCDVVAGSYTSRLEPLPRRVDGLLDGKIPDRYRACWTKVFSDKPNVDEGELTSCARKHKQRAVGIVRIGKPNEPYPGERKTFQRSNRLCGKVVAQWRGNPKPGNYGLQWPRRHHWQEGDRHATCWAVTTK